MKLDLTKHIDLEAEQILLGTLISYENAIIKCYDKIEPQDFYNSFHQKLYECLIHCFAKNLKIEVISIQREYKKLFPDETKDHEILKIADTSPSDANVEYYIKLVKNKSLTRQFLRNQYNSLNINITKDIHEIISDQQAFLVKLTNVQSERDIDFHKEINIAQELLDKRLSGEKKIIGWRWSSEKLTELSGGIEKPFIYVFGGLKKTGKSKFIIDQIYSLYQQNIPCLFLSLEMGKSQVTRWIWSRFAEIDSMKIRYPVDNNGTHNLTDDEYYRLLDAKKDIENLNDLIMVNTKSFLEFTQIKAKIYQAIQQLNIQVVLLDHLQRCNIPNRKGQNEAKAIEEFVFQLADLSKEYDIALIMLSQLANVAENKMATIKDLKHSGGIGEGVDFIGIMNRLSRIDEKYKNSNIMNIDVWQRDGQSNRITIEYDLATGRFQDKINHAPF